jgi:UDP-N-acetylglucosamine 2-epimerase (non-hydrolysing)
MITKIAIALGTHAEVIKMAPILLEFQKRNIPYLFIHTGQHNLEKLITQFQVNSPDIIIDQQRGFNNNTGGAFVWGFKIIPKMISYLKKQNNIEYVLVHGDTISCFASTISCWLTGKKIIHVEAGLRSGNILSPMPEDIIRHIADFLSFIKFAPSIKSAKRLKGMSINVGNTIFDSLPIALKLGKLPDIDLQSPYAIASIHRYENLKSKKRMKTIIDIMSYSTIPVYWFLHKNSRAKLIEYDLMKDIGKNIILKDPLDYLEFIHVLKDAQFVISDGGGISCECAYLNLPILIMRYETEREEFLNRWDQVLSKFDMNISRNAIDLFSKSREKYKLPNPYYNGISASKQIVDFLEGLR